MRYTLITFGADYPGAGETLHRAAYYEACSEAIIHFHHFFELVFKRLLRDEHPLLASDASSQSTILHKLLKGEAVDAMQEESLKSLSFREALERIQSLIAAGRLGGGALDFLTEARPWLERLNALRNRLSHRGTYLLRYPSLDEFVGGRILPLVLNLVAHPNYADRTVTWKYRGLACGVDPIDLIIQEVRENGVATLGKLAFAKELGRAAYENPIAPGRAPEFVNREVSSRAERISAGEEDVATVADVITCPVCGVSSLVIYEDTEFEGAITSPDRVYAITWLVRCYCCSFEMTSEINNASAYGLPIADFWYGRELTSPPSAN